MIYALLAASMLGQPAMPDEAAVYVRVWDYRAFGDAVKQEVLDGKWPLPKGWYIRDGKIFQTGIQAGKEIEIENDGLICVIYLSKRGALDVDYINPTEKHGGSFIMPLAVWRQYADRLKKK